MAVMSRRVVLGVVLCLAGMFVYTALDALHWTWPLNILAIGAFTFPGAALFMPAVERRVAHWLGRPYGPPVDQ